MDKAMPGRHEQSAGLGRVVRFIVGNWASRIYLGLVVAAALFLVWDRLTYEGPDASFAGVYLIVLTGPWSWLAFPLLNSGPAWVNFTIWLVSALASTLANAALISGLVHLLRRGGSSRPAP